MEKDKKRFIDPRINPSNTSGGLNYNFGQNTSGSFEYKPGFEGKNGKKPFTFADRAKYIMKNESDPKLQNQLLEKLSEEQEAYKEANGLNEKQQPQEQQMQMPQFDGTGNSWMSSFVDPDADLQYEEGLEAERMYNQMNKSAYNIGYDIRNKQWLNDIGSGDKTSLTFAPGNHNYVGYDGQRLGKQVSGDGMPGTGSGWGNAASFGMQVLPSVVSGAANYFSNQKLARKAGNYGKDSFNALKDLKSTAYLQDANYINLEQQRSSAVKRATDAKNTMNRTIKSGSKTRGEYMSNSIAGTVGIQRNLDDVIGQSRMQEAQYNQAEKSRIGSANAQTMNNNQNTNNQYMMAAIQSRDNWNQQALAYKQGQYGAPVSMMGDINKIMMQNQMIRSMGNHYGYEQGDWRNANMWNDVYKWRTT